MLRFSNGDRMPILGLGTWKSDPGQVYAAVREAIRLGYRHVDCALFYANEPEIGSAIRDAIRDGEVTREELWITSKLWSNRHGQHQVEGSIRESLSNLGLDYLDLYLIHWPIPIKSSVNFPATAADFEDPAAVPIASTWAGMEAVMECGLTRHIGVSNFSSRKLADLLGQCRILPEVNQVELHPLLQQGELVAYCQANQIVITAYSPLGSMDRPSFVQAPDAPVLLKHPVITAIAEAHGCTPAQVLLAWHVQRGIAAIPKSVSSARLKENLEATEVSLNPAAMEQIANLDQGYRFIDGRFWVIDQGPWTLSTIWDEPHLLGPV
jgi:alcohol dehydrogenase (NADP+)